MGGTLQPEVAFAVGRAAEEEEDFARARALFAAAAAAPDAELARRATAHLAYLDYYAGDFETGRRRAASPAGGPWTVGAIEAEIYRSVNAIALNRSNEALSAVVNASHAIQRVRPPWLRLDLRFRASRQLVHVLIARGAYIEALAEAERAHTIARRSRSSRHLGIAAYLRAAVASARGDRGAVALFREAEQHWGGPHHAFGRWLRHQRAAALRDQGDVRGARSLWGTTTVRLPWEDVLFDLAEGTIVMPDASGRPPDELPFMNATIGLLSGLRGDTGGARIALTSALHEFERCGLDHYRRGTALTLASLITEERPSEAAALIAAEMPGLVRSGLMRWPWWHRPLAQRLARFCLAQGLAVGYWRDQLRSLKTRETLETVLGRRGLSGREIEAVSVWMSNVDLSRAELAARLGVSEATVRNLLNGARRKLDVGARRGPEALRARIYELVPTDEVTV